MPRRRPASRASFILAVLGWILAFVFWGLWHFKENDNALSRLQTPVKPATPTFPTPLTAERGARESKTSAVLEPNREGVLLPKSILALIPGRLVDITAGLISPDVCDALALNHDQREKVQLLADKYKAVLMKREAENAELKITPEGDQYISVGVIQEGEALKQALQLELRAVVEEDKAIVLENLFERDSYFACFGKYPQEISIVERDYTHIGKGIQTMIEIKYQLGEGKGETGTSYSYTPENLVSRYGVLYKKLGLTRK